MADDVCIHICTCEQCTRFKQPQERTGMQPILVSFPLELIHLDFLTLGGKAGDNQSVHILVVTDHFTKYAQAYVTPKQSAPVVTQTLWENFLCIMDGLKRFSLIKGNLLKIVSLENCVNLHK